MKMEIRFTNDEYEVMHVDTTNSPYANAVTFAEALGAAGYSYKEVLEALEHTLILLEEEALEAADHIDREDQ